MTVPKARGDRATGTPPSVGKVSTSPGAAPYPDHGPGPSAQARVGPGNHGVAEVVAQNRLDPVGEVAQQDRVRLFAGRHRPVVGVDRFEHHPVAVDVLPPEPAAVAMVRHSLAL